MGTFPTFDGQTLEVVADTKLFTPLSREDSEEFYEPSITAFNERCEPVWMERFPYPYSEIGFKTLKVADGPMLQVAAMTIFVPADDTFIPEDLLVSDGGGLKSVTPIGLWGDKRTINYIGPIGPRNNFGIVQTSFDKRWNNRTGRYDITTDGMMLLWRLFKPAHEQVFYAFSSPIFVDMKEVAALKLPPLTNAYFPPFPLYQYDIVDIGN